MSKLQLISILFFLFLITGCRSLVANKNSINVRNVDSIIITSKFNDSIDIRKKLSKENIQEFSNDWNNSLPIGLCKYFPTYKISIFEKNGKERKFRTTSQCIKENDDYCFEMRDKEYFHKLFKNTE